MGKYEKLIFTILSGRSDTNIEFEELCQLLLRLEFRMRTRGSHTVFTHDGITEQLNLQKDGAKAKPYQVKQVRLLLSKYGLGGTL